MPEVTFPWDEHQWDKDLLGYFKTIIALRKKNPAFRRGDMKRLWSANGVYAYSRSFEGKTIVVALNVSEKAEQIHVAHEAQKVPKVVFGNPSEIKIMDGRLNLTSLREAGCH